MNEPGSSADEGTTDGTLKRETINKQGLLLLGITLGAITALGIKKWASLVGLVEETNKAASPNWPRPSDAHEHTAAAQVNGDSSGGFDAQAPHLQRQLDVYGDVPAWICSAIGVYVVLVAHMALVMLVNTPRCWCCRG